MSKKTEFVKSIALTVLVAMSVVLFANSWVREWSHSDNENDSMLNRFFSWTGIASLLGNNGDILPGTDIIAPSSVIFTSGAKRIAANKGTETYSKTYEDVLSVLLYADGFSASAIETDAEEWYYAQKNRSIYLDYGIALKKEILEAGLGISLSDKIKTVDSAVLTSNDSATNKLVIYFHDPESEKFYKILTDKSAKNIEKLLTGLHGYKNIPLAEELGFNTLSDGETGQQLAINGNNVIDLEGSSETLPEFIKFKNAASTLGNKELSSLLSLFGMSESSAKQYADIDGSSMYIDTNATLRFFESENGTVMEYTAASDQKGIAVSAGDYPVVYNIAHCAYTLVYSVKDLFEISGVDLCYASDITNANDNGFTEVYIDYCLKGIPLCFENQNKAVHAVQLRFNASGRLIYYKQILFDAAESGEKAEYMPIMNAVDKTYSLQSGESENIYIQKIYKGYKIVQGSSEAVWLTRIKGNSGVYFAE